MQGTLFVGTLVPGLTTRINREPHQHTSRLFDYVYMYLVSSYLYGWCWVLQYGYLCLHVHICGARDQARRNTTRTWWCDRKGPVLKKDNTTTLLQREASRNRFDWMYAGKLNGAMNGTRTAPLIHRPETAQQWVFQFLIFTTILQTRTRIFRCRRLIQTIRVWVPILISRHLSMPQAFAIQILMLVWLLGTLWWLIHSGLSIAIEFHCYNALSYTMK